MADAAKNDGRAGLSPTSALKKPPIAIQDGHMLEVSSGARPLDELATSSGLDQSWRRDLAVVLRRYGFLGLDSEREGASVTKRLRIVNAALERPQWSRDSLSVIFVDQAGLASLEDIDPREESGGNFLYETHLAWFRRHKPAYRSLLPHVSFSSNALTPILSTKNGRAVIGWWEVGGCRNLVIGLNLVQELVRYTQGDPQKVLTAKDKTLWGHGHERSAYPFEDNIVPGYAMVPWADRLGFMLARLIAEATGLPLIEPLPNGAKGAVLLTGDDDQAYLEKYEEQLGILDGFPITYIMLPHTKHSAKTLAAMPASVEFGTHVDALADPSNYAAICKVQTEAVRRLTGKPARTVRNHGHLNQGYWGHLPAWEECDLTLDLNIRGLDGTCPTGSYLPFRTMRQNGSWSSHKSLFSTFSDSMLYLQKWSQRKQIKCVTGLANQIADSDPGVIVINLHPQNVSDFHHVHRAVVAIGRRENWIALGAESYVDWLTALDGIALFDVGNGFELRSTTPIEKLAYYWPGRKKHRVVLPRWQGAVAL
jgi:hypothetical protein